MYSKQKNRKAKAGLFLIASPRFKNLGEGLPHGTYGERKAMQVEEILGTLDFLDVIFPGIVYEREDAVRAMERFYLEKADFIIAEFLADRLDLLTQIEVTLYLLHLLAHAPVDLMLNAHDIEFMDERLIEAIQTCTHIHSGKDFLPHIML